MYFKITRSDGKEDNLTCHKFNKYEEAYDFIEKKLGYQCCSDVEFENDLFYEIKKL
tara:strand:+ start:849 stop:1016 length:168 start_codon:yes stop_codon:yes gene_type:complete